MVIQDEAHAVRLARAILSDVQLYNADAIRDATLSVRRAIGEQIEEGRTIYKTRVSEDLVTVFDRELSAWLARMRPDLADEPGLALQRESAPRNAEEMFARERERSVTDPRSSGSVMPMLIAIVVLILGTGAWWFLRR